MRTDSRRVEECDTDIQHFLLVQFMENFPQHSCFRPALEASVDSVPVTIFLGKLSPRAARAHDKQDSIEYLFVTVFWWSAASREIWSDDGELGGGEHGHHCSSML